MTVEALRLMWLGTLEIQRLLLDGRDDEARECAALVDLQLQQMAEVRGE